MCDTRQSGSSNEGPVRRLTPLVGRGKLLKEAQVQVAAWLEQRYGRSTFDIASGAERIDGRNRLLVLTGPPAVGKSRMAYELIKCLLESHEANKATAHCVESASLSTFAAEITGVALIDKENLPQRWEELCQYAARTVNDTYADRARRHLPLLALLLDCKGVDTSGIRRADTGSFIHSVKLALCTCCEVAAHFTAKPVVLVIEDLQWMGCMRREYWGALWAYSVICSSILSLHILLAIDDNTDHINAARDVFKARLPNGFEADVR
jgi:hypothetical protein